MKPTFSIAPVKPEVPQSRLRLFTVPWSSQQTDNMIFKSREAQQA